MSAQEVGEIAPSVSNVNTRRTVEGRQARGKAPDIPIHERKNWLIHVHYIKKDFETCKVLIQELLAETGETCEYAIYVFGLISRQEGSIQLSLELFQKAVQLNPRNPENMKQMARSLFLLGRHKAALEAYAETQRLAPNDWEILHNQGVCHMHLKDLDKSIETFKQVLRHSQQAVTYIQLGKCYLMQNNLKDAVSVYQEAAEHNPEDPDILATMGLLYLELRQPKKAFEYLGNALTYDPCNTKAILAAGSMMQGYGDFDVALSKYRIAAVSSSESPQLWNNIGMCFFGKKKYVAAISCLKRAVYLAPFEWKILYNLGLVHLTMQQYSSAFHFLGAAISHKPKSSNLFMLLAVALTHMDDWVNAKQAYEQAIRLDKEDPVVRLNYAAALYNHREHSLAAKQFTHFEGIIKNKGVQQFDPEVVELSSKLGPILHVGEDLTWKPEVSQPQPTSPASGQPEN